MDKKIQEKRNKTLNQSLFRSKTGELAYVLYGFLRAGLRLLGLIGPVRRLVGPIVGRLLFRLSDGYSGPVIVQGHKMILATTGMYPPADMALGRYEPQTTTVFEGIVKPGMVVVDVGAHVGYYSLIAARLVGETGMVYSFEPEPSNYEQLVTNISLNRYDNVKALNYGLGSEIGTSTLYITNLDNGRHSMYGNTLGFSKKIGIETITLDSFLELEQWPRVDVIKIDVEGFELEVLNGMQELFLKSSELKLIIEFNPTVITVSGRNPLSFIGELNSLKLKVFGIDEKDGFVRFDEVQSAKYCERLLETESSINLYCTLL